MLWPCNLVKQIYCFFLICRPLQVIYIHHKNSDDNLQLVVDEDYNDKFRNSKLNIFSCRSERTRQRECVHTSVPVHYKQHST